MALQLKDTQQLIDELTLAILQQGGPIVDFSQGSNAYTLTRAVAIVLGLTYKNIDEAVTNAFISTASGDALEAHTASFGVSKKQGTLSQGNLIAIPKVVGAQGILSPTSKFATLDGKYEFVVDQSTILAVPSTLVPITAVSIGSEYDLAPGTPLIDVSGSLNNSWTFMVCTDGLDTLGNPTGFLRGGSSEETDDELRTRFVEFINSLSRSTFRAVRTAVASVPDVESFVLKEHDPGVGWFTVYLDDGTDALPQSLIDAVTATLDATKALGIAYEIKQMPKIITNITLQVKIDPGFAPAAVESAVKDQITDYLKTLQFGQSLYLPKIADLAYNVPGVLRPTVFQPLTDVLVEPEEVVRAGVITVTSVL